VRVAVTVTVVATRPSREGLAARAWESLARRRERDWKVRDGREGGEGAGVFFVSDL